MTTAAPARFSIDLEAIGRRATEYAELVARGDIVAGRLVRLACERHLRDLVNGHERGLYFDAAEAGRAIRFYAMLRHSKGEWAGKAITLELWQDFIVGSVFGWMRVDGTRRFRTAYEEISRKNGKSTIAAGTGLYLMAADDEPGAEVYAAATKRDQAKIVWGEASRMVHASPALRKRIKLLTANMHIAGTASKFEPLGADNNTIDGLNVHGAIVDELHRHKDRTLLDVIETAQGARRQPLTFMITTAGNNRYSVCYEYHDYSIKVLEGVFDDDGFFAYIATIDEGDDWTDPAVWIKANPNLGVSVKLDYLMEKCERAKKIPGQQNAFKQLHLDVWTEQAVRWLSLDVWDENAGPLEYEYMLDELEGRECVAGVDLSSTTDLTSVELAFEDEDGSVDVLSFCFVPEDSIAERTRQDRVPYEVWQDQGWLTATPGNVIDTEYIAELLIEDLGKRFKIREVAYDPMFATQFAIRVEEAGFTAVPIRQGFAKMSEPSKALERLLLGHKLRHGGHQVLRWAASNVAILNGPDESIRPDKKRSTERIDPIVALIIALARLLLEPAEEEQWHGIYLGRDDEDE